MADPSPTQSASNILVSPTIEDQGNGPSDSPDAAQAITTGADVETESDDPDDSDESDHENGSHGDQLAENFNMEHVFENGRRYANGTCLFPNDETEETRLAIIHQIHLALLRNDLTLIRGLRDLQRVLDVGSGPGDWAIAIGETYPQAQVIATDITTYQSVNAPPNVEFRIEDASQEWLYDEPFDLIHMRDVHSLPDFKHAFRQAYKCLKIGGTLQFAAGGPIGLQKNYEGSALQTWSRVLREAVEKAGVDCFFDLKSKEMIEQAGLSVYKQFHMNVRLGEWTTDTEKRRVGRMGLVATCESVEASSLRALTKYLGWTVEQAQELIEKVKVELMDLTNEPYFEVDYIVAKRLPGM